MNQLSCPTTAEETIRVCLVEDDARLRGAIAEWLREEAGLQLVNCYPDAESAIRAMAQDRPDVVLVDINLPGLSGIECVRQLKPQLMNAQFAMVTVYEDPDKIFQALTAGATGYLLKQTRRTELVTAIRDLHRGGSPMSPPIARKVVGSYFQPSKASAVAPESRLSARERQVLDGLTSGDLYKEIADSLGISMGTLHSHIRRIYEKLHVHSRAQAAAKMSRK